MSPEELDAIKTRAKLARWRLQKADAGEYDDRVMIGLTFVNAHPRVDDDLFALIAEVERLRKAVHDLTHSGTFISHNVDPFTVTWDIVGE